MTQLRHVARMAYGAALASEVRSDGDVVVMSSGGVTGTHNAANTVAPCIVIGRKGSYGSVHWSDDAAFVIDTAYYIDNRFTSCDLRWLYYALRSVDLRGVSQDVGVPGLSREAAYNVRLPDVPSLEEQNQIADFLDDQVALLDRAIALRQQQMALLDERRSSDLADLFSEARDDRTSTPLTRLLLVPPCYGVLVPQRVDEGVPFIRIGDLPRIQRGLAPESSIRPAQSAEYRRTIVAAGDVLTAVVGTLGTSAIVGLPASGSNVARAVCRLQPASAVPSWFIYAWLSSVWFRTQAERSTGGGTAQATLNMGDLAKFSVAVPDDEALDDVADTARLLMERYAQAQAALGRGLALLRERKQALITAAVTGQFDVTTAESVA